MKTAAREFYRKLNNDNLIPDIEGEPAFTPDQMIWFAEEYAQQSTLNRDKVMEVAFDTLYKHDCKEVDCVVMLNKQLTDISEELTDALCSLSLPTLSEGEIECTCGKLEQVGYLPMMQCRKCGKYSIEKTDK